MFDLSFMTTAINFASNTNEMFINPHRVALVWVTKLYNVA